MWQVCFVHLRLFFFFFVIILFWARNGRDVAIDASSLTVHTGFMMPQRGIKNLYVAQTALTQTGLLFCWSWRGCSVFNKDPVCCSFLHVLDLKSLMRGERSSWVRLPNPPHGQFGHIQPDACFYIHGTRLYLFGGTSYEDGYCCDFCSPRTTSETVRGGGGFFFSGCFNIGF
jgi:hypothetical protein